MRAEASRNILAFNGGSSSLKFAAHAIGGAESRVLARGGIDRLGTADAVLHVRAGGTPVREERCGAGDIREVVPLVFGSLDHLGIRWDAAGHRIVHGGPNHLAPERIDDVLLASLREATPFAPLHLPVELGLIEAVREHAPELPQAACFDTAFHALMPLAARTLALPVSLRDEGIRRYGFHGLSYESIVDALGPLAAGRVIVAHLGNGASMAALQDGESRDTTMGFTPCGGLVMGTRTGDLDPGVLVYLGRTRGMDAAALETLVNRESGLLALSETTSDMQALLAARDSDPRADVAIAVFCYTARKWIGSLAAALGGLDSLVFTGGIGEHAVSVREEICRELAFLGIALDPERNTRSEPVISAEGSRIAVRVIPTDEELMVARHTARVVFPALSD